MVIYPCCFQIVIPEIEHILLFAIKRYMQENIFTRLPVIFHVIFLSLLTKMFQLPEILLSEY